MKKPVIGISGSWLIDNHGPFPGYHRSYVNDDYVDSVVKNGGVPYIIPFNTESDVITAQMENVDALILSGGHDVDPYAYGEEPLPKLGEIWPDRDRFDQQLLLTAEKRHLPVLGICRGAQLINVIHGGSLYQDLGYRDQLTLKHSQGHSPALPTHTVRLEDGTYLQKLFASSELMVNSFHHQLIKDVPTDLMVNAQAADGVVEGFENSDASIIGVQWHPEMLHRDVEVMNKLFIDLVEKARKEG